MKKILAVFLSLVILLLCIVPSFAKDEFNDYPIVVVPGYSSSTLKMTNADGTESKVWSLDFNEVFKRIGVRALDIVAGAGRMTLGDYKYLPKVVGEELVDILDFMVCNPDGSSMYDIDTIMPNTADACRWTNLADEYKKEQKVMARVQEYVSDDMIYGFNCDFRMGVLENADRLNDLIVDIVETTGCEKVNILAISHGGQITGTYLSVYGTLGYVNNAVMCMPAMGGAALAYDIVTNNIVFDEKTLINFLEYGFELETDYHWLVEAEQLGFLDKLLKEFAPYVHQVLGYWGSIWDFIPLDYFDETVKLLDPVESAKLIEQTTYYHENIMSSYAENLNKVKDSGVNITILAGSGMPSVTGLQENSDAILRVKDTTGAECAPFGKRFADGYKTLNTMCDDPSHNHLSPSMEVDASCAWLPDNTWYVDGMFHGMELYSEYTIDLVLRQLLSAEPMENVYADKVFPQFHAASSRSGAVHAQFDNSTEGYLSSEDNAIIITNNTLSSPVTVYAVKAQGVDITFEKFAVKTIQAGESVKIKFTGDIPETSLTRAAVTVHYVAGGSLTPLGFRTFDFTVMNGDPAEYDSSKPYADVDFPATDCKDTINSEVMSFFGRLSAFITKIFTYIMNVFKVFA